MRRRIRWGHFHGFRGGLCELTLVLRMEAEKEPAMSMYQEERSRQREEQMQSSMR